MRDDVYVGMLVSRDSLKHYGKGHDDSPPGRGSGRYAWGSGKNPKQSRYTGLIEAFDKLPDKQYKLLSNVKDAIIHLDRARYLTTAAATLVLNPSWFSSIAGLSALPGITLNAKYAVDTVRAVLKWRESKKRKEKEPIDKKTGFHLKLNSSTPVQDCKDTNPLFGSLITQNIHNCALCSIAYEMRRRGYDVTAKPSYKGMNDDDIKKCYKSASWRYFNREKDETKEEYIKGVIDWFERSSKNGQRGNLCFRWDYNPVMTKLLGGAHSITYEVENGKLVLRDAQCGKIIKDPYKFLKHTSDIQFLRIDNREVRLDVVKRYCE